MKRFLSNGAGCLVVLLITCSPVWGQDDQRVHLQIMPRSGDTFRAEIVATNRESIEGSSYEKRTMIRQWFERKAESISSKGCITWSNRLLRFQIDIKDGERSLKADSSNVKELAAMLTDPDFAGLVDALEKPIRFEQDRNGGIPNLERVSGNPAIEPLISVSATYLPEQPIAQLQRWTMHHLRMPPDIYGSLNVVSEGVFLVRHPDGKDDLAEIAIRQDATFEPDKESPVQATLAGYKGGGLITLSLKHGRPIFSELKSTATYRGTRNHQPFTVVIEDVVTYRETN